MSMTGNLVRVTEAQLNSFLEESQLLINFLESKDLSSDDHYLDIDKSWEAINYLLTGHTSETIDQDTSTIARFFFSEQPVDEDQDMGYGPAYYLRPEQVKEVNKTLVVISEQNFIEHYDADKMNADNVYHQSWENGQDDRKYLTDFFRELKNFYAKAAAEHNAVITYIT